MTTNRDRLQAWIDENELGAKALATKTNVTYSFVINMLSNRQRISDGFKYKFAVAFGFDTALSIFSDTKEGAAHPRSETVAHPEKYAAHSAITKAIRHGKLLPAKAYRCQACPERAHSHHHPSYHPDDHLCVVPLCRSCHRHADLDHANAAFGIVATPIGIIRIAIAALESEPAHA